MTFDVEEQIKFKPEIRNVKPFNFDNVIVGGMGGSALPARAMFYLDPVYPLWLHNDFGLPKKTEGKTLFIAISYSGNTKETLSFATEVFEKNLPLAIITSGGALKDFAEKGNLSYVLVPPGLEPRDATLYMLKSLLAILGRSDFDMTEVGQEKIEAETEEIADFLTGGTPLLYSSATASALAYIWKIYLNETAKTPAFCGILPELFHNEIESLNDSHRILVFSDGEAKGVDTFMEMAAEIGWHAKEITLSEDKAENIAKNLGLARSVARAIAEAKGVGPDRVPVIEEFKKKLK